MFNRVHKEIKSQNTSNITREKCVFHVANFTVYSLLSNTLVLLFGFRRII